MPFVISFNYIACLSSQGYRTMNLEGEYVCLCLYPITFGFLPVVHHLSTQRIHLHRQHDVFL